MYTDLKTTNNNNNSELPSNLLLKHLTPKIWLPLLTTLWGVVTMCLGFVHSFASFFAVRAILGLTEGGLLPGMVLYLSGMYTRGEIALRIGVFYTAASLSGAFGGEFYFLFTVGIPNHRPPFPHRQPKKKKKKKNGCVKEAKYIYGKQDTSLGGQ